MAYFVSSQILQGYDPNNENIQIVKYHFEVDTESDIPTQNQFSAQNVKIAMTSTTHVIQNDTMWEMRSDGTWVKQKGDFDLSLDASSIDYNNTTSGMTADNVQDAIDEIADLNETKITLADIYGVKPGIAERTDLNTMTTPGAYACGGATLAVTLGNCPTTTDAFILFVDHIAASIRTIQRLYCMNTSNGTITIYVRGRYSGGWSSWYKFEGTPVTTTQSVQNLNVISTLSTPMNIITNEEEIINNETIMPEE